MTIPTYFKKTLGGLRPACPASEAVLGKLALGAVVEINIRRPRNLQHHRKWWALLSIVADNLPGHIAPEALGDLIKIRIGHVIVLKTAQGLVELPKSISFAAMDQTEFEAFYDRALAFICEVIMPGLARADLEAEVAAIIKGRD